MKTSLILFAVLLTGCAEWQAVKSGVATHGASYEDSKLEAAHWYVCRAASVGAVVREYRGRMNVWAEFCDSEALPDVPANP